MRGRFLVLMLFFALLACESPPPARFSPQLVVHCLLRAGEAVVFARVNRTYDLKERFNPVFPDARVRIFCHEDYLLRYGAGDTYYTDQPVPVNTGDTWQIQVVKSGFDTVWGRTVVPAGFDIGFPRNGDTVSIADSIVWSRSRNACGYYLSFRQIIEGDTSYLDALIPNDSFGINYDPLFVRIPRMLFLTLVAPPPDSPPRPCTLWVWALDTNYYHWVRGGFGLGDSSRVTGGLGVLGSAVERWRVVFVRGDTTVNLRR